MIDLEKKAMEIFTASPGNAFDKGTFKACARAVRDIDNAFHEGDIKQTEKIAAFHYQKSRQHTKVNGVWVDYGISFILDKIPPSTPLTVRISGSQDLWHHEIFPDVLIRDLFKSASGLSSIRTYWQELALLLQESAEALIKKYEAVVLEVEPRVQALATTYARKLEKGRERAARPEAVAKRQDKARERSHESLSVAIQHFDNVLDNWSAEQLFSCIQLCNTDSALLKSLTQWVSANPLGSKVITVEDVKTVMEMTKVKKVMKS